MYLGVTGSSLSLSLDSSLVPQRLKLLAIVKCIKSSSCHPLDAFPTCALLCTVRLRLSYLENHRTAPAAATVVGGRSGLVCS